MLFKNLLKKIHGSLGRYLSIVAIVFIGAAMLAGLASSAPDMVKSAGSYYAETKLMDFKIVSTLGLTEDDVSALKQVKGVESVTPSYSLDVLDDGEAIRVHAIEKDVNGYVLKSGHAPAKDTECLADDARYKVGDVITVTGDTEAKLARTTFTVAGTIQTPLYISSESYGNTTIGDGKIHSFIFIPRSNFAMDVYTEVYVRAKDTSAVAAYSAEYNDAEKAMNTDLLALAPSRTQARYDEILADSQREIDENQAKLNDEKSNGERELADAKTQLDDGASQLASGKATLVSSEATLRKTMAEREATFASARTQIAEGWSRIDAGCAQAGLSRGEVHGAATQMQAAIAQIKAQLSTLDEGSPEYAQLQAQIQQYESMYAGIATLDGSIQTLSAQESQLNAGIETYKTEIAKAQAQIASGKQEIAANEVTLREGQAEYEDGLATFTSEIADAQAKLDDAQVKIDDLEMPAWHIYTRDDITGYEALNSATGVIVAVTKVFPVFFVLIVMLMISNTMARMIVEERGELGTLTSLGYGNATIIRSYLIYVLSASLLGGVVGYFVGCVVIPTVIAGAFGKFIIPPLVLYYNGWLLAAILVVVSVVMVTVTLVVCYAELRQKPASLMRPVPPKGGQKSILLERITPLWNRMTFTWKVTMRNLFRSKKRALMIIVGVAGCTALLITGFGLRDSIDGVAEKQFGQLIRYDNMLILKDEATTITDEMQALLDKEDLADPLLLRQETFSSTAGNRNLDAFLIVPQNNAAFKKEYSLRDASSGAALELNDDGVIVTSKFAQLHNVGVGDTVTIKDTDENAYEVPVSGIAENYMMHYIYASPRVYERYFSSPVTYNAIAVQSGAGTPVQRELAQRLIDNGLVLTVANNNDALEQAESQNKSIDTVVVLVVVIAGLLALVVLYNLTSINISERTREVATLKVLGFTDKETDSYIYRETIILTLLSILIGFGLGLALHGFAINVIEGEGLGLFKTVLPPSYLYSAVIVILLALFMQAITHMKLKRIDMIDSLKSVE